MKSFISLMFIILSITLVSAQDPIKDIFPTKDGKIYYQKVVILDSSDSGKDIYIRARNWMIDAFKSSKNAVQFQDDKNYIITGKGFFTEKHNGIIENPKNWFTIKIEAKNGRYRYTVYDLNYEMDITFMSNHQHFKEPLEKWYYDSQNKLKNEKQKEKANERIAIPFLKKINTDIEEMLASLKDNMAKKAEAW